MVDKPSVDITVSNRNAGHLPCRRKTLHELAERICWGEGCDGTLEISVLFCDDMYIARLNKQYRNKAEATDVLSFPQDSTWSPEGAVKVLGDVVISMETVSARCCGNRRAMRDEVLLLFCHGVLHLLGYEHHTPSLAAEMNQRQADYLGLDLETAWRPVRNQAK